MKTASSTTNLIACAAIAGAFAVGFATGPAFAQAAAARTDDFKFDFSYKPSELTDPAAAEKLLSRLQRKIRAHCGGNSKLTTLDERSAVNQCINATMKESISKFGSATLAQAYDTRAGG